MKITNFMLNTDEEGNFIIEIFHKLKKITLYITPKEVNYIKISGEFIKDMEDGNLCVKNIGSGMKELFKWLYN